ncbi:MAG TPA: rhomboid family intramembrane serine protease [Candidatus Krumholzibacteria bacterium]|nr:rhomboid family intramembrane serine protease [Candidatus Krumholzibacteria bacterium]
MFPLKDHNPTLRTPVVTIALIAINLLVFGYELLLGDALGSFVAAYGAVPYEITHFADLVGSAYGPFDHSPGPPIIQLTLVTSMFMHGSVMHIIGNMLYLWIFGNNVEDLLGRGRFLFFYLVCGIVAGLAHILVNPTSTIPTVGASGAVAGVLGAYMVAYPRARVLTAVFILFFIRLVEMPAAILLVFWFVMQSFQGFLSLGVRELSGGVAWFAHVGGFIAGVAGVRLLAAGALRAQRARRPGWPGSSD